MQNQQESSHQHEKVGERHNLALPIELEEGAPPFLARAAMAVITGLIVLLLVWANIARVREMSVAVGKIAPYGETREAAHLEGGIVDEVLVQPGDIVAEGDALVRLRAENGSGDYQRLTARRASLKLRSERLSAQAENREPDFSQFADDWPGLRAEQSVIFSAAVEQHRTTIENLSAKEESSVSEVTKATAEFKAETELLRYAQEQLAIQEELIRDGYTSKQSFLQAKSAVSSAQAKAAAARSRLEQSRRAYTAAHADRLRAEAEYSNRIAEERASIIGELAELEDPIASLKDRSERLTVRAPIAGIVNQVLVRGKGDVVRSGGVVAEITPTGAQFMAEVRINPKDIGHIAIGLKTDITVTTFDPNRYGKISGSVAFVSPDALIDQRTGENYYVAYIALGRQDIGKGARARKLTPGMQVRADIITQSRTLMQYLFKPVARSLDQAFTER